MTGTGCRIGEAAALTEADIDFENRMVTVDKSLQYHDLRIDEYYENTIKTEAGERVEELPGFAIDALKRVIIRNKVFDEHMADFPGGRLSCF
ncbi:tyrosine-type recombinase/integrase [Fructilactobacillus florum]|uniref:tyrosine-type recombinase/integrase n=1 Tax=Fructilactobacillus florum TaxID=640331 RepID=UPI0002F82BD7|nr:tyrosine-type recombinase/integrase [Fructilactobacillus florum]